MQIIVLGTHCSGASLVTRVINMMGAFFDSGAASIGFSDENPKGFWERSDVIAINDRLLDQQDSAWDRLAKWKVSAGKAKKSEAQDAIEQDLKIILLTLDANRPWVVKDPRMCLTFSSWRAQLELPVVVCVYRDPLEVALSLKTRNGFTFAHGMAIWEYYAVGILNSIRGLPVLFVEHRAMLADPLGTVKTLFEKLQKEGVQGLRLPSDEEITSFIEPSLYRSRLQEKDYEHFLTPYQKHLAEMMAGRAPLPEERLEPSMMARDAMEAYEKSLVSEAQIKEMNNKLAAVTQEVGELRDYRQKLSAEVQQEMTRVRRVIEEKDEKMRALKASKSWKIGHAVMRFITLRWFSRPEATQAH